MSHTAPATPIEHYENFPVASVLCPAHLRAPIAAIYHFARTADDLADEGAATASERLQALADYRRQLVLVAQRVARSTSTDSCISGNGSPDARQTSAEPPDPRWSGVFGALEHTLRCHHLPLQLLHDLLDAFVQDIEKTRDRSGYRDQAELLDYCRRSANPVGRLLLHLYGVGDPQALRQSDAICSALQLINFWQDPSVDIPRGRYYFTQTHQAANQVDAADLLALRQTPAITAMVRQCVDEARALMASGAPLVHAVPGRMGWELRLVVQGGLRILDKIEALHYATLRQRPTLGKGDYALMLWRALWM